MSHKEQGVIARGALFLWDNRFSLLISGTALLTVCLLLPANCDWLHFSGYWVAGALACMMPQKETPAPQSEPETLHDVVWGMGTESQDREIPSPGWFGFISSNDEHGPAPERCPNAVHGRQCMLARSSHRMHLHFEGRHLVTWVEPTATRGWKVLHYALAVPAGHAVELEHCGAVLQETDDEPTSAVCDKVAGHTGNHGGVVHHHFGGFMPGGRVAWPAAEGNVP